MDDRVRQPVQIFQHAADFHTDFDDGRFAHHPFRDIPVKRLSLDILAYYHTCFGVFQICDQLGNIGMVEPAEDIRLPLADFAPDPAEELGNTTLSVGLPLHQQCPHTGAFAYELGQLIRAFQVFGNDETAVTRCHVSVCHC